MSGGSDIPENIRGKYKDVPFQAEFPVESHDKETDGREQNPKKEDDAGDW